MTTPTLRTLAAGFTAALALGATACGSDSSEDEPTGSAAGGSSTQAAQADAPQGKQGGTLKQLGASDVDFLDPGKTYYTQGYQVALVTHRPLYGFVPGNPEAQPDLAAEQAEVSEDQKTVTVKIKPNVKFGPPVNRAVTSDDVKYAFERSFSKTVQGQYASAYFAGIVGAPEKLTSKPEAISGITTPDSEMITFALKEPTAASFVASLVMPISAPVPRDYAKELDAKTPSTYNENVVASGPYMVKNDAKGSVKPGFKVGRSITLVRNPNWDRSTDFRPAYLDQIDMTTNNTEASVAAQQVLKGQSLALDTNPPAAELADAVQNYQGQFTQIPSGGYRYFPMNAALPPFDDVNVRKAVAAGFDREAARKARGGRFTGDIPTHFLPPDFPGHDEAGGMESSVDFLKNPRGDMALAAKYFQAAGMSSGKYEGDAEVLLVGANVDPGKAQTEVAQAQLEKLGFTVKTRLVPQDAVYNDFCQLPAKKVNMCGGAGWFKDFNDPASMLEPTFKGENIVTDGGLNNNQSQLKDPAIDAAMEKADVLTGQKRLDAFGAIDKQITAQAPAVPFLWDKTTLLWSKNVQGVADSYSTQMNFAFSSLK